MTRRTLLFSLLPCVAAAQSPPPARWPARVVQPPAIPVAAGMQDGFTVFETDNFTFSVETEISSTLMRSFARCAEGTRRLWHALPCAPPPAAPGEKAEVRILRSETSYRAAGGPDFTAGFFRTTHDGSNGGRLLVNAESLGIDTFNGRTSGGGYAFRPSVLIHELSHQATAAWLPHLPLWLREGLAEYGALVPLTPADGTFRLDADSLRTALRRRCELYRSAPDDPWAERKSGGLGPAGPLAPWLVPLQDLVSDENVRARLATGRLREWHGVYFTSLLTVFYLLHLAEPDTPDGERPLLRYLRGLTAGVRHFVRKEPDIVLPPELPADTPGRPRFHAALEPLLWHGATPAETWPKIVSAFAGIRVPLTP